MRIPPTPDATSPIPVSERVLQVLAAIARSGHPISARELAAQTQLPLSTVYRHLLPLKKWGLVQQHAQTGLYEPGPLGVQLAWGFDQHSFLMSQARSEIEQLVAQSGESVGLLVHVQRQVVCLDMQESEQALRCSFAKGRANSPLRGASAKALLAFTAKPAQDLLIAHYLPEQPDEQRQLKIVLQQIYRQGYAVSENEVDQGVWGVSAPVFSGRNKMEATLSLMAPVSRAAARQDEWIQQTLATAARISQRLRAS
ncbi:IclR family transcriptional regulator [Undibacterium terreum]|uniref:Transcriptional regulator n=1 Tax=Undibacterium terreum TaxID=1224302 RepID=A0A916V141_9BURK|nr:IclR family transcriptional regulator [Undibacterium terreum]GGD01326.1 transcriptional regulator [Undibacterium terreum]